MPEFYAQPYNIDAKGFYFKDAEELTEKMVQCYDRYGQHVEEFEVMFIDGDELDYPLFEAWGVHQGNVDAYLNALEKLDEHEIIALIAMSECGYDIDADTQTDDVSIYHENSLKDLAVAFVDEGLFGTIPASIQSYSGLGHQR